MAALDEQVDPKVCDTRQVEARIELEVAEEPFMKGGRQEAFRQAARIDVGHDAGPWQGLKLARNRHHHRMAGGNDHVGGAELDSLAQHCIAFERSHFCRHTVPDPAFAGDMKPGPAAGAGRHGEPSLLAPL